MQEGCFYYLSQEYFDDFPDPLLMGNKETINGLPHNRPCFYAFKDSVNRLDWLIPISSQVHKFKAIYNNKIQSGKRCNTIVFGQVLGKDKAFLIQNMCPITDKYILNQYKVGDSSVRIARDLEEEIQSKARKVLTLQRKGIKVIFPDVLKIEQQLLESLRNNAETERNTITTE